MNIHGPKHKAHLVELTIHDLTDDILGHILSFITDPKEKRICSLVCKLWMQIVDGKRLRVSLLRSAVIPTVTRRFRFVREIDCSKCRQITDGDIQLLLQFYGSKLINLNLSKNKLLTDSGFQCISLCENLEELNLSYCNIKDEGLRSVSQCKNLKSLNLENCRSVGNQGVKRITDSLKNLEVLNLKWCNNVGDEAFYSIALDLPNLLTLNLSYTKVALLSLRALSKHQKLLRLSVAACPLLDNSCLESMAEGFRNLLSLDLSASVQFEESSLRRLLLNVPKLEHLNLHFCRQLQFVDGEASALSAVVALPNLQSLKLDNCTVTNNALQLLWSFPPSTREISLRRCQQVGDSGLHVVLRGLSNLTKLDLTCCKSTTDRTLDLISQECRMLTSLHLESCHHITQKGLLTLAQNCKEIQTLDCTDCQVDDDGLVAISKLERLEHLKVGFGVMSNSGVCALANNCRGLKSLDLYRCENVGTEGISEVLKNCTELEEFNVSYTNFEDEALESFEVHLSLKNFETRGVIGLSSTGVTSLAQKCPNLEDLDLKHCSNVGDLGIISVASFCKDLRQINVSYTKISHTGVRAISNLPCLGNVKLVHCANITPNDYEYLFNNCLGLKKVKVLSRFKSVLSQVCLHQLESRGCTLRWIEKPDP